MAAYDINHLWEMPPLPWHTIRNPSLPPTRLHLHLGSTRRVCPHGGENSFLEAKIVFYIRTIWESGKKYFLVLHDNNSSISSCLFFFCEFHNSKSLILKYLWETEKNGLFFWQPTPSGCYFQLPGGAAGRTSLGMK